MKLLIPDTIEIDLPTMPNVTYVQYKADQPIPEAHQDAEAIVLWGNPLPVLKGQAKSLTRLKWVQSLQAGANLMLSAGFPDSATLTLGRGLHDLPVAEHTLALILAAARRLHELRDAQHEHHWAAHLGGRQPLRYEGVFRSLHRANVLLLGFGSIAQRLAPLLTALGARVQAVARSQRTQDGIIVHPSSSLDSLLSSTDLLVLILPSTKHTQKLLDERKLALLPSHAWIVNVGRGDTVDESALIDALRERRLGGAALDVFEVEPLPADSPFWELSNVIISPHAGGGRPLGAHELVLKNLERFLKQDPLLHVVEPDRGY